MKLNLELLQGIVTMYGAPLYSAEPTTKAGSVTAGEYSIDGDVLVIPNDNGTVMYIPVRTARKEQGMDETQTFNIGIFTATRDASGEYNGKPWSVKAGDTKPFAY
jgi:hypothetical protein